MRKSHHARRRQHQRAVREEAIQAVLRFGIEIRQRGGRVAYFLGFRQVEAARLAGQDLREMAGTVVVLARDGTVVTVIRTTTTRRLRCGRRY